MKITASKVNKANLDIKPNVEPKLISSEKERRSKRPHRKGSKLQKIVVNRQEIISLDKANLPSDAKFKGYKKVIVQDIALTTNNVCFLKEIFYSPSLKKTYLAPNPTGFEGQFGPTLKALALTLYFDSGLSEPKLKDLFEQAGVFISAGQISNLLITHQETFSPGEPGDLKGWFVEQSLAAHRYDSHQA